MHRVKSGSWKNAGFAFLQQNKWVGVGGDWHSDDYFRILMPTRGGGNAGSSPLHYVDRKMRVFLPSLDVSYGSSPAGTFGQLASKSFLPLWKETLSEWSGTTQPGKLKQYSWRNWRTIEHQIVWSWIWGLREYRGGRSTSLGSGGGGVSRSFHRKCRLGLGCEEWKQFFKSKRGKKRVCHTQ